MGGRAGERGDGDEQIMKRLRWSGREGGTDGIKVGTAVTAEMITSTHRGGQSGARQREGDKWGC